MTRVSAGAQPQVESGPTPESGRRGAVARWAWGSTGSAFLPAAVVCDDLRARSWRSLTAKGTKGGAPDCAHERRGPALCAAHPLVPYRDADLATLARSRAKTARSKQSTGIGFARDAGDYGAPRRALWLAGSGRVCGRGGGHTWQASPQSPRGLPSRPHADAALQRARHHRSRKSAAALTPAAHKATHIAALCHSLAC